jgi:hypothetical protein
MTHLLLLLTVLQPPPPPPGDEAGQLNEAKQHFERGKELFKSGAYDQAIQEFRTADQIKPSPILAYNIGLSYENLGRCKAAISYFQRYLREQPEADNRADTEQKIQDQNAKLARGECAGQRAGQPPPPPGGGGDIIQPPPPGGGRDVLPPPSGPPPGHHGTAIGLRFGPIFGGLGNELTKDLGGGLGSFESSAGFHLEPAIDFPLIVGTDGRVFAMGEVFGTLALYGFNNKIGIDTMGNGMLSQVQGNARFLGAGFAMRGNFFVSERVPIAISPALGFGVGVQLFNFSTADGVCDFSSGVPTAFVNLDLAVKYELAEHHAFYFSPANLHFYLPGLSDGGELQPCGTGMTATSAEKAFGTDSANVNYGIDLGYMFQF